MESSPQQPEMRPPAPRPRRDGWPGRYAALAVAAAGWLGLLALCLWEGSSGTVRGTMVVLMVLVAFWHGCALGRAAGALAAIACAVIGLLALRGLGLADAAGPAIGLAVAGVGGGLLRRRFHSVRGRLEATEAHLGSLTASLDHTRAEMTQLQHRLGEAERLATVGTMSAQIAHQLRNPLTSIGLYIQLVEDELRTLEPDKAREAIELLERVLNEQHVLVEITDNYLKYARLPDIEPATLDINRTVADLVRFLRHEMERKGIAASTRLADGPCTIEADRRLLGFALMNLLKNAIEAMDHGGRLRVRTAQHNGSVEIHVSDTGPGIAHDELGHVFEPFYTTKDAGSGLGLSLSRQIIEKHQGALTCQSMVGVGTTFVVSLPARAGHWSARDGSGQRPDDPHRG